MRNAIIIAADNAWLSPAIWLWRTLTRMNTREDTDIILISEEQHATLWGYPVARGCSIPSSALSLPDLPYPTNRRIPKASYWRLAAPSILATNYRLVLYLDVDVLPIDATLFECFDYDLSGAPLAACESPTHFEPSRRRGGRIADGQYLFDRYFNAGVMLIDTQRFIECRIAELAFEIISREGTNLKLHDQTALNLAADGKWADLSLSYNFWAGALGTFLERTCPPKIVHYYGKHKPWHLVSAYPSHRLRRDLMVAMVRHGAAHMLFKELRMRATIRQWLNPGVVDYIREDNQELLAYLSRRVLSST